MDGTTLRYVARLSAWDKNAIRTALIDAYDKGHADQPMEVSDGDLDRLLRLFDAQTVTIEGRQ